MKPLFEIARFVTLAFFFSLFGIVAVQLLTGNIRTRYLFHGVRSDGSRYLSPERVQLLLLTMAAAFNCLTSVLENPTPGVFPHISETWVALLGGSQALFVGAKSYFLMRWKPDKSRD